MALPVYRQPLAALALAAKTLSGELQIETVLQGLIEVATQATGARYGALGVIGDQDELIRFITVGIDPETIEQIGDYPKGLGLLGQLISHPEVLRLDDLREHPASIGVPEGHPPMTTFLGAPVRASGAVYGNFYLTDKPGGFTEEDEAVIEVLATQAGLAISNALQSERLQLLAVQDERDRISRDLHDNVIQSLFSIGMGLESVRGRIAESPDVVGARIDSAVDGLDETIRELRNAIFRLRPLQSAERGLSAGLIQLVREYQANTSTSGAPVRAQVDIDPALDSAMSPQAVSDILHIVREALTNAIKHAAASTITVSAHRQDGALVVVVADDGVGFDRSPEMGMGGNGLPNIRSRAAAVGGDLEILTRHDSGTTVRLEVPVT